MLGTSGGCHRNNSHWELMTAAGPIKQKLTAVGREHVEHEEEDEAKRAERRRPAPGKNVDQLLLDPSAVDDWGIAPGKLSVEQAGGQPVPPAAAIRYADWIASAPRVDRRAEVPEVDD